MELITERRPELVFHLAAQADVRVSVVRPVFDAEVNVLGSLQVLEGARRAGTRKVVVASSGGTIYGEPRPEDLPVRETHPQRPVSPYGVAKKVVDDYLFAYRRLHGLDFTALALANVYGPRQDPNGEAGVVAIFAGKLLSGDPCVIFGDGKQTRDFVYVDDVVDAFFRSIDAGSETLFNIGTGVETSVNELYESMAGAAGVTTSATHAPARAGELARSALDPSLAGEVLGWRPADRARRGRRGSARVVPERALAEEVFGGVANHVALHAAIAEPLGIHAAHDGNRHSCGLSHDELGRGRDLVDDGHFGHLQFSAERIRGAAQIGDGDETGAPDRHVGDSPPPRTAEGVGHDDGDIDTDLAAERIADSTRRTIGVLGKQRREPACDVRKVDAGVGAHESVPRLGDDEIAPAPQHAHGLALDDRLVRERVVGIDGHDLTLDLRDDLLRHHQHVVVERGEWPGPRSRRRSASPGRRRRRSRASRRRG